MPASAPVWVTTVANRLTGVEHHHISRFAPPPADATPAAVLVLLRDRGAGPETVVVTRASTLRAHAGQVAFPGGAVESDDADAVATALREAAEETTLDLATVHPIATWPTLWIPVSGYAVTSVFAWCDDVGDVAGRSDDGEILSAHDVPLHQVARPIHRRRARYPNGAVGPAFDLPGLFIWGFTGLVIDRLLHVAGWEQPWEPAPIVDLPATTRVPPASLGPHDSAGEAL